MPGNEKDVVRYLIENKNDLKLNHLKKIQTIESPTRTGTVEIKNFDDIEEHIKPDDAHKKADILINGKGISIKQESGSVLQNKIQRKHISKIFGHIGFSDIKIKKITNKLDNKVKEFHEGKIVRDVPWRDILKEDEFKKVLEHYMMKGSNKTLSNDFPSTYILTAPKKINQGSIEVYSLDEYFDKKKDKIVLAIRRAWPDQASKSESKRALGYTKHLENKPWVLDGIAAAKKVQFKDPIEHNNTCHYINIIENK